MGLASVGGNPFTNPLMITFSSIVFVLVLGCSCTSPTSTWEIVLVAPSPSAVVPATTPAAIQTRPANPISVVGHVVTIGNDPFTQWAIETSDGKVYGLTNVSEERFREFGLDPPTLQTAKVEIKGFLTGRTPPSFRTEESIEVIDVKVIKE